jgi:hypothetical protein
VGFGQELDYLLACYLIGRRERDREGAFWGEGERLELVSKMTITGIVGGRPWGPGTPLKIDLSG